MKIISVISIVTFLLLLPSLAISAQKNSGDKATKSKFDISKIKYPISEKCKAILKDDLSLRSALFKWLYYTSCGKGKSQDYQNMYFMLSQEYLGKYFPHIKSAPAYEKEMEDRSEIYHTVYLLVEDVEYIKNDIVKIKLIFESGNEGVLQKMEKIIFFKKEKGSWKYNGIDVDSLKVIETIE